MSWKVVNLVYSRIVGSAHRKAILAYMADRASDGGEGVYCSKGTISDETEIARSTVFKVIKELVADGVLIERGTKACTNGHTVVYDMDLSRIEAFPEVSPDARNRRDQSASRTSPQGDQSVQRTPPVRQPDPYQSASRTLTTLGTTGNQEGSDDPLSSGDDERRKAAAEISAALAEYNTKAAESGWPEVRILSRARRSALAARLRECGGLAGWAAALAKAQASPHCSGQNDRGWVANFDFLTRQSSFAKLMEGNYDRRITPSPTRRTSGLPENRPDPALANIARIVGLGAAQGDDRG